MRLFASQGARLSHSRRAVPSIIPVISLPRAVSMVSPHQNALPRPPPRAPRPARPPRSRLPRHIPPPHMELAPVSPPSPAPHTDRPATDHRSSTTHRRHSQAAPSQTQATSTASWTCSDVTGKQQSPSISTTCVLCRMPKSDVLTARVQLHASCTSDYGIPSDAHVHIPYLSRPDKRSLDDSLDAWADKCGAAVVDDLADVDGKRLVKLSIAKGECTPFFSNYMDVTLTSTLR